MRAATTRSEERGVQAWESLSQVARAPRHGHTPPSQQLFKSDLPLFVVHVCSTIWRYSHYGGRLRFSIDGGRIAPPNRLTTPHIFWRRLALPRPWNRRAPNRLDLCFFHGCATAFEARNKFTPFSTPRASTTGGPVSQPKCGLTRPRSWHWKARGNTKLGSPSVAICDRKKRCSMLTCIRYTQEECRRHLRTT